MAGILFTDGKFTLSGVNKYSEITGIGGKRQGDETTIQTAIRETIEELFELEEIPNDLLELLHNNLTFNTVISRGGYSTFVMDFKYDLEVIFNTLKMFPVKSRVYYELPSTLLELILERKILKSSELSHILLVPNLPLEDELDFDGCFVNDIRHLKPIQ